ncbi:glycosyltransferase family 9 protein [bacterium]|nr:MAG: glycosyltransferase family 9 protein [bacterium]
MAFKNILIFQTAFLGDVVLTTPLFRGVKRLFPSSRLTLLTTPEARPLVEEDPFLDAILTFDKKKREGFSAVLGKIRGGGFDLLLSPHRSHRTSLIAMLSGIPVRVGYGQAGFSFAYNRKVERKMELHEADRILGLLRGLGKEPLPEDRTLFCGYTCREGCEVTELLEAAGVKEGEKLAGIAPGSVWATKRWLPGGFAEVGRELLKAGLRPVLIGGPDDAPLAEKIAFEIGPEAVNAAGKTRLKALPAWMDRFEVFITNDSAPLHVAGARSTPTVAIFGATVRELGFGPLGKNSRVVETSLSCRPCGLHGGRECPEKHFRCMADISPRAVMDAVRELLGER